MEYSILKCVYDHQLGTVSVTISCLVATIIQFSTRSYLVERAADSLISDQVVGSFVY